MRILILLSLLFYLFPFLFFFLFDSYSHNSFCFILLSFFSFFDSCRHNSLRTLMGCPFLCGGILFNHLSPEMVTLQLAAGMTSKLLRQSANQFSQCPDFADSLWSFAPDWRLLSWVSARIINTTSSGSGTGQSSCPSWPRSSNRKQTRSGVKYSRYPKDPHKPKHNIPYPHTLLCLNIRVLVFPTDQLMTWKLFLRMNRWMHSS